MSKTDKMLTWSILVPAIAGLIFYGLLIIDPDYMAGVLFRFFVWW